MTTLEKKEQDYDKTLQDYAEDEYKEGIKLYEEGKVSNAKIKLQNNIKYKIHKKTEEFLKFMVSPEELKVQYEKGIKECEQKNYEMGLDLIDYCKYNGYKEAREAGIKYRNIMERELKQEMNNIAMADGAENIEDFAKILYDAKIYKMKETMDQLARMYYVGYKVKKNITKGIEWFEKAHQCGNNESSCILVLLYFFGEGDIKPNWENAYKFMPDGVRTEQGAKVEAIKYYLQMKGYDKKIDDVRDKKYAFAKLETQISRRYADEELGKKFLKECSEYRY